MNELIPHSLVGLKKKLLWGAWWIVCICCLLWGVFISSDGLAQPVEQKPSTTNPWNNPEEYDWYVLLFFHKAGEVDSDGDPERKLHATWYTKPGECERRMKELQEQKPPTIVIDALICFPIKKEPEQKRHIKENL